MAKRRRGPAAGGAGGGMGGMMAQIQKMQADMEQAQKDLEHETVDVSVGGGALQIVITGHQRIRSIEIDEDLIDAEEKDMLQDMLVAAVNAAIEQSQTTQGEFTHFGNRRFHQRVGATRTV